MGVEREGSGDVGIRILVLLLGEVGLRTAGEDSEEYFLDLCGVVVVFGRYIAANRGGLGTTVVLLQTVAVQTNN